jgi:hypothetical protein
MSMYYYTALGEKRLKPRYVYAIWSGLIGFLIGVAVTTLPGMV